MKKASFFVAVAALLIIGTGIGTNQMAIGHEGHGDSDKKLSKRDHLRIGVQKICPVSGEKLGDHGSPIKAKVGKQNMFLCCNACTTGKVDKKHWATIHKNFAQAQGKCPVMKKKLPKKSKWTIVEGQIIYICCPPCKKKIDADPKTYLKKLDEYYKASLELERKRKMEAKTSAI